MGNGMARIGGPGRLDGTFCPVVARPPERRVDRAFRGRRLSPYHGQIGALQRACAAMIGKLCGQMPMGAVILGDDHDTACVLVQPVNNARPPYAADSRKRRTAMVQEGVDQGSRWIPRTGVDHQSGLFRQNHEILVLMENVERNIFRPGHGIERLGDDEFHPISGLDLSFCFHDRDAVDSHRAADNQFLDPASRNLPLQDTGQPTVEPARCTVVGRQLFPIAMGFGKGFTHDETDPDSIGAMMSNAELDHEEDKPLDPEMEKVRRKMVRLLAVSLGIMFLGVMAVLVGVVYKVMENEEEVPVRTAADTLAVPAGGPLNVTAALPSGFRVDDVSLDGSKILFYGRMPDGGPAAYIFDIVTEKLAARVRITDQD